MSFYAKPSRWRKCPSSWNFEKILKMEFIQTEISGLIEITKSVLIRFFRNLSHIIPVFKRIYPRLNFYRKFFVDNDNFIELTLLNKFTRSSVHESQVLSRLTRFLWTLNKIWKRQKETCWFQMWKSSSQFIKFLCREIALDGLSLVEKEILTSGENFISKNSSEISSRKP